MLVYSRSFQNMLKTFNSKVTLLLFVSKAETSSFFRSVEWLVDLMACVSCYLDCGFPSVFQGFLIFLFSFLEYLEHCYCVSCCKLIRKDSVSQTLSQHKNILKTPENTKTHFKHSDYDWLAFT